MVSRIERSIGAMAVALCVLGCASRPLPNSGTCSIREGLVTSLPKGVINAVRVDEYLYFDTLDGSGQIDRVPLGGGSVETLVDKGDVGEWGAGGGVFAWMTEPVTATPESPTSMDVLHIRDESGETYDINFQPNKSGSQVHVDDSGNVFWVSPTDPGIERWDHATHQMTLLATGTISRGYFVDGSRLYWMNADATRLMSVSSTGGTPSVLAAFDTSDGSMSRILGFDDERVYVQVQAPMPPFSASLMTVKAVPKAGGGPAVVANGVPGVFIGLAAVDERNVYWVKDPGGGYYASLDIERLSKTGGGTAERVATIDGAIAAIAVDACNLYTVTPNGLQAQPTL
jgi:hypothetical protein